MTIGLATVAIPTMVDAESRFTVEDQQISTQAAHLDFTIIIPAYVFLSLGMDIQTNDKTALSRIIGNGGTLALSLPLSRRPSALGHSLDDANGAVTDYKISLPTGAEVSSRNETVTYIASLP